MRETRLIRKLRALPRLSQPALKYLISGSHLSSEVSLPGAEARPEIVEEQAPHFFLRRRRRTQKTLVPCCTG